MDVLTCAWAGLDNRARDVALLKLTEACSRAFGCDWGDFGVATLLGFRLAPGAVALPGARAPWLPGRRVEVIGDSITAAWAARAGRSAGEAACNDGEDASASWAHVAAVARRAEVHIVAWGGVGLHNPRNPRENRRREKRAYSMKAPFGSKKA